jgi:hypothetical protein
MKANSRPGGKVARASPVLETVEGGFVHTRPETHLDDLRERHSDLLREARAGELAARIAESRRRERRSFLERLWRQRSPLRPATQS